MTMVTQVIRVLQKLELGPRATKITRCVSNLRIIIHPELSLVLPVLACTNRLEINILGLPKIGTDFWPPVFRL